MLAPIKPTGAETDPTYRYLRDLNADADDVESSRLLYVAATRAEKRLHLMACLGCDKDGELKHPAAHTLLSRAWSAARAYLTPESAVVHGNELSHANCSATFQRLGPGWRCVPPPESVRWDGPRDAREEEVIEFSWAGDRARHIGSLVHRWLQQMAEDKLKHWDTERIRALAPYLRRELHRRGVQSRDVETAAELVTTALTNALTDERGRWVLGPHAEMHSEYRLRGHAAGRRRTFVIDRFFRLADGTKWIVDFKTSFHEGAGIDAFLDREEQRYAGQLEAYADLIKNSRQGLYFPLLRGWRERSI